VFELRDELTVFRDLKNPNAWTGHFRGSPARWKPADGHAVVTAVLDAKENPVTRPVDAAKLARRPRALKARIGPVTVPDSEEPTEAPEQAPDEEAVTAKEPTAHTEIQWSLLKLGNDMGLDVWVARNDRSRDWNSHRFTDLPRLRPDLPLQFDEATNRTIELIDVLWLKGNAVVAAFEIESTTSIYSGLLRMSDLIAMQPTSTSPCTWWPPTSAGRRCSPRSTGPLSRGCRRRWSSCAALLPSRPSGTSSVRSARSSATSNPSSSMRCRKHASSKTTECGMAFRHPTARR
jgi:hypothetical protein